MAANLEKKPSPVSEIVAAMKERALDAANSIPAPTKKLSVFTPQAERLNITSGCANANAEEVTSGSNTLKCSLPSSTTPTRCPTPFPDDETLQTVKDHHAALEKSATVEFTTCTKCGSKIVSSLMRDHLAVCNGILDQTDELD